MTGTFAQSDQSLHCPHEETFGPLATHWAHCKDSDQAERIPRLIWVFAGCVSNFVGFVVLCLIQDWVSCLHNWARRSLLTLGSQFQTHKIFTTQIMVKTSFSLATTVRRLIFTIHFQKPSSWHHMVTIATLNIAEWAKLTGRSHHRYVELIL